MEALIHLAQDVLFLYMHVIESEEPAVTGHVSHDREDSVLIDTLLLRVHEEAGDATLVLSHQLFVGHRKYGRVVSVRRIGDPLLGAVEHPAIVHPACLGLQAPQVRTGVRFGQREADGLFPSQQRG